MNDVTQFSIHFDWPPFFTMLSNMTYDLSSQNSWAPPPEAMTSFKDDLNVICSYFWLYHWSQWKKRLKKKETYLTEWKIVFLEYCKNANANLFPIILTKACHKKFCRCNVDVNTFSMTAERLNPKWRYLWLSKVFILFS